MTSTALKPAEAGILQVSRGYLPGPQVQGSHEHLILMHEMLHETLNINEAVCRETLVNPTCSFLLLADESVNGMAKVSISG